MRTKTKRIATAGVAAVCALSLFAGVHMLTKRTAVADDAQNKTIASTYFYDNLKVIENGKEQEYTLAKKFYKALEEMYNEGDFLDGEVEYSVTEHDIVTSSQLEAWVVGGDVTVPKAFSAARDAFLTDHPELFYIDFYKMTISVGRSGGVYSGYIDSGREANLYCDNGFNSVEQVNAAIKEYNAAIDEIATKALNAQKDDKYYQRDEFLVKYVNKYLAENIKYDYAALENNSATASSNINTSYGGLVVKQAVCGGFSRAFKAVMDKLEVPCITVNGYSNQKDASGNNSGSSIYHMWNYVWLENPAPAAEAASYAAYADSANGEWYGVDVTWNSAAGNKYRYAILSAAAEKEIHVTDGVISSSGYELKYPALSSHNFGSTGNTDGLQNYVTYTPVGDEKDDYGQPLMSNRTTVSYNGKGAKRLQEEDGLYLVVRFAYYFNREIAWTKWMSINAFREYAEIAIDNVDGNIQDTGNETWFTDNTSVYYTQFAVFDTAPDFPTNIHSDSLGIDKTIYMQYKDNTLNESKAIAVGKVQVNESFGTYTPAPYVSRTTPNHGEELYINDGMGSKETPTTVAESKAFVMEITYTEPLHVLDESKPIGISFVSEHPNAQQHAKFYPVNENGDLVELVERAVSSGDSTLSRNTLRFKFAPSLMYEHNREGYEFVFTNVGSSKEVARIDENGQTTFEMSNKIPNTVYYNFSRLYLACPARFNYDGRLWVDCCAQPTLVSNSDLAAMDFKDEDGNSTFSENERSQMMLVAEKAETSTVDTMLDEISGDSNINVNKEEIEHSETYDIRLQICGKYPTIPDGSYVKIALGFPQEYGPDDEGVTFKLFHRKHDPKTDTYTIEEVPCVVTKFGIVATVTSFSPYMVAVVDAEKAVDKTVYASIEGKGGKLTVDDGKIQSIKEGGSYTYTIVPDAGYKIYSVKLNGTEVKDKVNAEGKLTVNYADLQTNNELEIQYISEAAAQRYEAKEDFEIVEPVKIFVQEGTLYESEIITGNGGNGSNLVIIVSIVAAVVVVAAVAIGAVVIVKKKKEED